MRIRMQRRIQIEPTNNCNIRCSLCPVPKGQGMTRARGFMKLHKFHDIITEIKGKVDKLKLWNFGEPFIHPQLFDMVKFAEDSGIFVSVSTNASLLLDKKEEIFSSRLSRLVVCLDGATKQTHECYRTGSDFSKITSSIKQICNEKNIRGSAKPEIIVQTLANRYNENELDKIIELANELGADGIRIKMISVGSGVNSKLKSRMYSEWMPLSKKLRRYTVMKKKLIQKDQSLHCSWYYGNGVILWNGDLTTCCYDYNGIQAFANVFNQNYKEILASRKMSFIREKISNRDLPICKNCKECGKSVKETKGDVQERETLIRLITR